MTKIPDFENSIPQGGLNRAHFIGHVISEVFGIQSPIYVPNAWFDQAGQQAAAYEIPKPLRNEPPQHYQSQLLTEDAPQAYSSFGTPVLGVMKLAGGRYNTFNRRTAKVEQTRYEDYTLPYSCLVDFSRENNVIITPVLGSTGTVKEIYGIGDWEINIRGIAFNKGDEKANSAHEIIARLVEWTTVCDAITVEGDTFYSKNINRMVIKRIDVQPMEAKYNVIPFQIQAISDQPIELQL